MRLTNKVALITGGAGGIGLATARLFLAEGAKGVAIVDFSEENLKLAEESLGREKVLYIRADVSHAGEVQKYTKQVKEKYGRIDVLFLNAGTEGVVKPMEDYPEETFDQVMGVNVKGVWLGMKYAFPIMKADGGGSVIITSSVAGLRGTAQVSAYVGSKHATIGLMRVGALEGAPGNIRVNSIHPSPVDNRMMRSLEDGFAPGQGESVKENFTKMIPLGRYASNEDIADLALFLASEQSKFITGATYVIDGGFTV
ncbi:NAD(P)-dependent dehydrogenase, short-chain alcohol dehydrogenase family [Cyclobacterium xiamenense]|uniref:NAD(P)-dependent dehydrogenase, short-chain alcohol dehydrogenase family n=1 Tax=Cyclobacterium xiamenense TaxID=1297121 RepID=A0A1H6VYZ2_9BACT|nr:SDR family NAD(P)-dependent oxidoreductase [Cyclobacterium xiamenense]SEJ09859.1 NAD(P)-dependent dehydrogenase, short-chain alcohol dehydrogenase family [Cyclobacterium xiamenense]